MRLKSIFNLVLVVALVQLTMLSCSSSGNDSKSNSSDITSRIDKLLTELTPEEKIGIIVGDGKFILAKDPKKAEKEKGIIVNDQRSKMLIPRLGIRTTAMTDGPSGLNREPRKEGQEEYKYTTAFPTATCLAASWNTPLVEEVGKVFGNEALEYDYDLVLAPGLNIHRNPRDGRSFEYYSEDPFLSGKMAASMVNGIQSYGIGVTLKHLGAHNQQTNRRHYNAVVSQRALREIYLRGFEIAVKESNPKGIMTSYNKLNGFFTAESPELIKNITRNEWGFDGIYVTDFGGAGSAVSKVRAGSDIIMSGSLHEYNELNEAFKNKTLDESTLDVNLRNILKFKLNSPREKGHIPTSNPDLIAHAKVARQAAGEGMVLLKNKNNTLPLNAETEKKVALFGKISYHLIASGTGSGTVRSVKYRVSVNEGLQDAGIEVPNDLEQYYVNYIQKIRKDNIVPDYFNNPKMRKDNKIVGNQAPAHFKNRLVAFSREKKVSIKEIKEYESKTDFAVITLGRTAGENYENGYLPITKIELDLVSNVSKVFRAAGKKVIVVLNIPGVWEIKSWEKYADAILVAWLPGQEGGYAVADILTGKVNPSGKLPDSFPLKYEDVPSAKYYPKAGDENTVNSFYGEGIYVGYRYYNTFNVPTAYEFGYGLSYTTFEYSDIKLSSSTFKSKLNVSLTVTNTGKVEGKEIVQLYLNTPSSEIEKPEEELKSFAKTKLLKPGESQQITFELDEKSLASFWSGKSAWVADKGNYEIRIGSSSKNIRLKANFTLNEEIIVEEVEDVLHPNVHIKELKQNK